MISQWSEDVIVWERCESEWSIHANMKKDMSHSVGKEIGEIGVLWEMRRGGEKS